VFGGLLVLQRSETLDAPKAAYLVAAAAVVVSAGIVLWQTWDTQDHSLIWPWIGISVAFMIMIAISLPVALAHGVGFTPWLRGAATYALFAAAPLVAFDARRVMSTREAVGWMTVAGGLAAVSFSIYWLQHRHIVELGIDPLVLPSAQLAYAGFAVAVAYAFRSSRAVPWAVTGGLILGALLITGTRTTFLLLAIPALLAVIVGRSHWKQTGMVIAIGGITTVAVFVVTIFALSNPIPPSGPTVPTSSAGNSPAAASPAGTFGSSSGGSAGPAAPQVTARPDLIGEHLGSVGTILVDPGSGQSLTERIAQTRTALVAFVADPLLGSGPGSIYTWTNSSGRIVQVSGLDTPFMIAAEFGLLGIVICLGLVGVFLWFIRLMGRTTGRSPERLSMVGLATSFGLTGLLGPPMDDKGAAYALALVLTIALTVVGAGKRDHA
jgi:hypothetical protein